MNRLFLTGDTHGDINIKKLSYRNFPLGRELDKNDCICILGDFGCIWNLDKGDNYWLNWLESRPFTTLFLPGNHENYPLLRSFPEEQWYGGTIRRIRPSVIMLERGEIFNIANATFFCMGGARSVDKVYRKEGKSWWPDEMPSYEEYQRATSNLERVSFQVTYILTHCGPNYIVDKLFPYENQHDELTSFFEKYVRANTTFSRWFMGHYHIDRSYDNQKYNILYNDIIELFPNGEFKVVNN